MQTGGTRRLPCAFALRLLSSLAWAARSPAIHLIGRAFTQKAIPMAVLVDQSVKRTLFRMAFPMLAGTFAMNAYSLTDTWFVAQLGTLPLAAMGFIFPVVMLLTFVAAGIGTGMTALTSHALGRHDQKDAARFVTNGIVLMMTVSAILTAVGYLTIEPIFRRLGADDRTMPYIHDFMSVWYFGAITMALPMVGNGILISAGDSKAASRFMIFGTVLNAVLNPIMIFGFLGFPALGIRGSALATVVAQGISTAWLFYLLRAKHHLLDFAGWRFGAWIASARDISHFAIPSILSMVLMPISATVITHIVSGYGPEAVAAVGAAGRIEMFAFVIPMALGMSLTPFMSQNFGAGRMDRIREAMNLATRFALLYGAAIAVVFFLTAPWLARVFTDDPKVLSVLTAYIRIISFGYGMMEVHRYCGFVLTGMHRPIYSTILNAVRVLVFLIPLSFLGSHLFGIHGVFWGRLLTDLIVGSIGIFWVSRLLGLTLTGAPAKTDTKAQP